MIRSQDDSVAATTKIAGLKILSCQQLVQFWATCVDFFQSNVVAVMLDHLCQGVMKGGQNHQRQRQRCCHACDIRCNNKGDMV